MQKLEMTQIEQVIGPQLVVRFCQQVAVARRVIALVELIERRQRRRAGPRRVAHPDPDRAVTLGERIGGYASCGRNAAIAVRVVNTLPGAIEAQPVIGTFDRVAADLKKGLPIPIESRLRQVRRQTTRAAKRSPGIRSSNGDLANRSV